MSDEITNFLSGSTLVGHNLDNFDLKFLNYHLDNELQNNTLDTLTLKVDPYLRIKLKTINLILLAEYFEVTPPTHSAKDDVMTTFEIYKKLSSIQ